ncbi:MAG: hypothetical protein WCA39_16800, partial [Nitrososphaeraceae archaeon]
GRTLFNVVNPGLIVNRPGLAATSNAVSAANADSVGAIGNSGILSINGDFTSPTTSQTVTFTITVSGGTTTSFTCSLDDSPLNNCGNPGTPPRTVLTVSVANTGDHHLTVQALNSANQVIDTATVTWTLVSTLPSGLGNAAADTAASNAATSTATGLVQQQFNQDLENTQNGLLSGVATDQAATLNPIFQNCPAGTDLALYTIYGSANLNGLFSGSGSEQQHLPEVSLLIYNKQLPLAPDNLIINNNTPYLKGVLVSFPGNINDEKRVNFQINKLTTDCKNTALIDKAEELGGPSPKTQKPSVVKAITVSPPFSQCLTAPGATTSTKGSDPKDQVKLGSEGAPVTPTTTAIVNNLNNQPGLNVDALQAFNNNVVNSAAAGQVAQGSALATAAQIKTGGQPVDVAKYTIRGLLDRHDLGNSNGQQNIVFKIFNDVNKGLLPEGQQTVRVFDSNNQFAATMDFDPGKQDWKAANFVLHELSTSCRVIPFVDKPMTIGDDAADFSTQPRNDHNTKIL